MRTVADKIQRVGLAGNPEKTSCAGVLKHAAHLVASAARRLYCDAVTQKMAALDAVVCADIAALAREVDLLLVFGGDGTILRVAREIAGSRTPVLGINIGSLGFLTGVPSDDLASALKSVWAGRFEFESRAMLQASIVCGSRKLGCTALNDIVVSRGMESRLIELDVRVDGAALTRYRCDGLILSTATGSTAYSLAAGGAVVFPTADVLALTPICPHTLSNRPLVLPLSSTVTVKVISPKPATVLSADGQGVAELSAGDSVTIRRSRQSVRLVCLEGTSFAETLRRKLHWRGTPL